MLLLWNHGITQSMDKIQGLHQQLAIAKDDTSRIKALIILCANYRLGNKDSSLFYGEEALKLSRAIHYPAGEIGALSFMSLTLEQMGNYPKSLEMGYNALKIAKEHHLENLTAPALNAMGEVHIILKDFPKALGFFRNQKTIAEKDKNPEGLAYALYDLGVVYEQMNQLDSAFFYEQLAIEAFSKTNRMEPWVYRILGDIEMKSGNHDRALDHYQESLQIALHNNERRALATAFNQIANYYKIINQPDSVFFYAMKGLEESRLISQKKTILEAATLLTEYYANKDAKEELRYLKLANTYKDSLFGAGNITAIQVLVSREEEYQKEIEAAKVNYQNQLRQYYLIAGIGMLLLIALVLYRNNRQKVKANIVLQSQKEEIQDALFQLKATQTQLIQSEKMASLGELTAGIAHEIQNPLNFVNNFSEINTELSEEIVEAARKGNLDEIIQLAGDIKSNQDKISEHGKRADAIVKGMLQHSRSSSGIKEPTDINKLADEYFRLSYHGLRAKDKTFNAALHTDFDPTIGKIPIMPQDIGRVLLNLYNNAFYVVSEKQKLSIEGYEPMVSLRTRKINGEVEICVADNGSGIPEKVLDKVFQPFFTTKPTGQGTGLGLSLSYDIINAHGGNITIRNTPGTGAEFIITLPINV